MKKQLIISGVFLVSLLTPSCFKEIDTEPIPRTVEETFTVQNSIRKIQSFFRFYENTVLEIDTASHANWDLAFESAADGDRVLLGWASFSTGIGTGLFELNDVSQDLILDLIDTGDWTFDDPSFLTVPDTLMTLLTWEDGEVFIHNRGLSSDTYYAIQFVSRTEDSYTFRYASAQSLSQVHEATIYRSTGFNYVYFSYNTGESEIIEPPLTNWDILFTPYRGWWETSDPGKYAPFSLSGILINNENGVRIAHVFDPEVAFEDIGFSSVGQYEFTDLKGAVGANWKVLGDQNSNNIYSMDPDKKYLMKKYDFETDRIMYFKFQMVDYKLDGEDHHPTVEFKYLGSE
ncbi:MAG: hypothetical protein KAR16_14715 [Bacteroidales bacterium]|nr:hypothetical protein [Bacteroidales bacterium]